MCKCMNTFSHPILVYSFAQVTGTLVNTGHSVLFKIDTNSSQSYDESRLAINITGGPLSYRYRFEEIHIHYGLHDQFGSEHSVQGYTFPAEVIRSFFLNFGFWRMTHSQYVANICPRNNDFLRFYSIDSNIRLQFTIVYEFHGLIESCTRNYWHFGSAAST